MQSDLRWNACVSPSECALCVGIPLDRAAVEYCAGGPRHGFIPGILQGRTATPKTIEQLWNFYESQVARPVIAACDKFAVMGVTIRRTTAIDDLRDLARHKKVVILWTHWSAPPFEESDITDPDRFVTLAQAGGHWVHREVYEALGPKGWGPFRGSTHAAVESAAQNGVLCRYVVHAINALVERARDARTKAAILAMRTQSFGPTFGVGSDLPLVSRVLIEQHFPACVVAGNPLELSHGMATAPQIINALPSEDPLVLDLTMCNAAELMEVARRARPRVRVIAPEQATDILTGMLLVNETLELLKERPRPYLQARALAIGKLIHQLVPTDD